MFTFRNSPFFLVNGDRLNIVVAARVNGDNFYSSDSPINSVETVRSCAAPAATVAKIQRLNFNPGCTSVFAQWSTTSAGNYRLEARDRFGNYKSICQTRQNASCTVLYTTFAQN